MPVSGAIKLADANVGWRWRSRTICIMRRLMRGLTGSPTRRAVSVVTQMALLRHLTNSKIMGPFVQSQQDAWKNYDKFVQDPRVVFLSEPPGLEMAFRNFTQATSPSHTLWTDAYLASLASQTQTQLVTFDQGFRRFAGLDLLALSN